MRSEGCVSLNPGLRVGSHEDRARRPEPHYARCSLRCSPEVAGARVSESSVGGGGGHMEVRHQRAQLDAERVPVVGLVEGALDERLDEVGVSLLTGSAGERSTLGCAVGSTAS